jgi:hypothetical protein
MMETLQTPTSHLKQEIIYLREKLDYQQSLLDDERRVTDELLKNKSRAIEALQQKLTHAEQRLQTELDLLTQSHQEVRIQGLHCYLFPLEITGLRSAMAREIQARSRSASAAAGPDAATIRRAAGSTTGRYSTTIGGC